MQTQPIVDGAPSPEPMLLTAAVVPQRSTRRSTARRASDRRATARERKDMAKGLNANRRMIAAEISHMIRAGELTREPGSRTLSAIE
jgi:hypothetical protein